MNNYYCKDCNEEYADNSIMKYCAKHLKEHIHMPHESLREELRSIIVKRTSEMLDNPDTTGIFPTSKFYNDLIEDIVAKREAEFAALKEKVQNKIDQEFGDTDYSSGRISAFDYVNNLLTPTTETISKKK